MLVGDYVWNMPGQTQFQVNHNGRVFVFASYGNDVRVSTDGVQMPLQYRVEKDAYCLQIGDHYLEVSPSFNDTARVCVYKQASRVEGVRYSPQALTQDELNQLTAPTKKSNRSVLLLIH